jgi:hypothetical protein
LADQDEFQVYPSPVQDVIQPCGRWDYVRGCFVDRIARDRRFPPILPDQPIWNQFSLGGLLTMQAVSGAPRKAAVRGPLALKKESHHSFEGTACPSRDFYIPIHHFKFDYPHWEEVKKIVLRAP